MSEGGIFIDIPKKIPDKPVKTIVDEVLGDIESKTIGSLTKLQKFMEEYDRQFHYFDFSFHFTQTEVLHIIKAPLTFYALNMNGQVLIDLAGLLERYAILYIEELFRSLRSVQLFTDGQRALAELLGKKSLDELAKILVTLGLWDKGDEKEAEQLYDKRNYVAHKNITKIRAILSSSKSISIPEIDMAMSGFDVLPYIFITIRLLSKMIDRYVGKTERYRIAEKLLQAEISNYLEYFKDNP
jgi:hypothetical protein